MPHVLRRTPRSTCALLIVGLIGALGLGGCVTDRDATGSIHAAALPSTDSDLRAYATEWGRRNQADPSDKTAALNYGRALRAMTQYSQATAVLEAAAIKHPYDMQVLGAYGKALSESGRLKEAADVLARAHTPEHPDWSILSAQGLVAEQLGDHTAALGYYEAALKISPGEPTVLSNLGLSYALSKDLPAAEATMQQAAASDRADMRIRQNYSLVLALDGKFAEAEAVARRDLSASDAAASIAAVRAMIARSDVWRPVAAARQSKVRAAAPPPQG